MARPPTTTTSGGHLQLAEPAFGGRVADEQRQRVGAGDDQCREDQPVGGGGEQLEDRKDRDDRRAPAVRAQAATGARRLPRRRPARQGE